MNAQPVYLASKPHYEILDGLRGVAALMVVMVWGFTLLPLPLKWDVRRWLTDRFLKRVKSRQ